MHSVGVLLTDAEIGKISFLDFFKKRTKNHYLKSSFFIQVYGLTDAWYLSFDKVA